MRKEVRIRMMGRELDRLGTRGKGLCVRVRGLTEYQFSVIKKIAKEGWPKAKSGKIQVSKAVSLLVQYALENLPDSYLE